MKKEYEALSVDVVKFEAQDVITASGQYEQPGGGNQGGVNDDKEVAS